MNVRICGLLAIAAFVPCFLGSVQALAQNAYITNQGPYPFSASTVSVIDTATNTVTATIPIGPASIGVAASSVGKVYVTNLGNNSVSVIDTATNTVTATIPVASGPVGVAVTPGGSKVYVANDGANTVSVIDTASNTVIATIPGGIHPYGVAASPDGSKVYVTNEGGAITFPAPPATVSVIDTATNTVTATITVGPLNADAPGVAVTPDGSKVYVTNEQSNSVSVIDTATNAVTATIPTGPVCQGNNGCSTSGPIGVAVSPDGSKVYVANAVGTVSVIDTATNTVTATIPVGSGPFGVAVSPDGSKVYVANGVGTVSVIDTATNTVTATIPVGVEPLAFGVFIPIPVPQKSPTAGNLCNGIYDGTFNGNVTVSAGQDCIFLNGKITGNVSVVGGNFALNNSGVGGNVTINGGGTYTLGPAATVGGNLLINEHPVGQREQFRMRHDSLRQRDTQE